MKHLISEFIKNDTISHGLLPRNAYFKQFFGIVFSGHLLDSYTLSVQKIMGLEQKWYIQGAWEVDCLTNDWLYHLVPFQIIESSVEITFQYCTLACEEQFELN